MQSEPVRLIRRKTGDWWQDERRHWCAYCGKKLEWAKNSAAKQYASREHVIPKAHGGGVTIPSCTDCNGIKKKRSVAEYLTSDDFLKNRGKHPRTEWSLRDLWLVMAMASVHLAHRHSDEWPSSGAPPEPLKRRQRSGD